MAPPHPRFNDLPISAATAYAQVQSAALSAELQRDVSHLNGSFGTKRVGNALHWYFSYRDPDQKIRQLYVGPDSAGVRTLVERAQEPAPAERLKPLCKAAVALGCASAVRKHVAVIRRLNEYGFFRAGGVLVGTHAFLAFSNLLGVRWRDSEQTSDVDFAHAGRNISVALPGDVDVQVHAALTTLEEGFLPLIQYRGSVGASYRHSTDLEFQVDFLTTRVSNSDEPIVLPNLSVALQPLRFMECAFIDVQQAVVFDNTGQCTAVNIPSPARYAVHKLLIIGERSLRFRTKVGKDVSQAAALLEYFRERDADTVKTVWADALSRGPGWRKRAKEGLRALAAADQKLAEFLST
jgi:hypothetical protein